MTTVDTWITGVGLHIHAGTAWPGPGSRARHRLIAAIDSGRALGTHATGGAEGEIAGEQLKTVLMGIGDVLLTVGDGEQREVPSEAAADLLDPQATYHFRSVEF